jgi:hypothetical protein
MTTPPPTLAEVAAAAHPISAELPDPAVAANAPAIAAAAAAAFTPPVPGMAHPATAEIALAGTALVTAGAALESAMNRPEWTAESYELAGKLCASLAEMRTILRALANRGAQIGRKERL